MKHGNCTQYFVDESLNKIRSFGAYKNGKRHGVWTYYHKNGEISCRGSYAEGKKTGRWIEKNWKGQSIKSVMLNEANQIHGYYESIRDGFLEQGYYENGVKQGNWKRYRYDTREHPHLHSKESLIKEYHYKDGKLNGSSTYYHDYYPFKVSRKEFNKNNELDGLCQEFDNSGVKTVECRYKKGK